MRGLKVLERLMRSAFFASLSGLCILCMCSRSLSLRYPSGTRAGMGEELYIKPRVLPHAIGEACPPTPRSSSPAPLGTIRSFAV